MAGFIDEVWTENPGVMLRVTDFGGTIELDFVELNSAEKPQFVYSAKIAKYRWERIVQGVLNSPTTQAKP